MDDEQQSDNVEDRRGDDGGGGGGISRGHVGIGTIVIAIAASYFFGIDPSVVMNIASNVQQSQPAQQSGGTAVADDENSIFVKKILHNTETTWNDIFQGKYQAPHLVLFSGATQTACGTGQTASGPFYCPGDQKVYIDLAFYSELKNRFHAPGDFAQAYVIAHEIGHHVQNLLGISGKVDAQRARSSEVEANHASVRLELQADCFAGVWAHHANQKKPILEAGDVEEALTAATAIGDDTLQQQARGTVRPDSFTHGTSAQRVKWFRTGLNNGELNSCDTFAAGAL